MTETDSGLLPHQQRKLGGFQRQILEPKGHFGAKAPAKKNRGRRAGLGNAYDDGYATDIEDNRRYARGSLLVDPTRPTLGGYTVSRTNPKRFKPAVDRQKKRKRGTSFSESEVSRRPSITHDYDTSGSEREVSKARAKRPYKARKKRRNVSGGGIALRKFAQPETIYDETTGYVGDDDDDEELIVQKTRRTAAKARRSSGKPKFNGRGGGNQRGRGNRGTASSIPVPIWRQTTGKGRRGGQRIHQYSKGKQVQGKKLTKAEWEVEQKAKLDASLDEFMGREVQHQQEPGFGFGDVEMAGM